MCQVGICESLAGLHLNILIYLYPMSAVQLVLELNIDHLHGPSLVMRIVEYNQPWEYTSPFIFLLGTEHI